MIVIIIIIASDRVGQMTTCVGISFLFCRSTVRCAGRRERERARSSERGEGGSSLLSVCTFFCSCIRWIQSRAHELSSLFGSVRPPRPARSLSPRSQLERTRALHVTSRPLQYKRLRGARGGVCVCGGGGARGGVKARNPRLVQSLLIRYTRPPPSCQAPRRTAPSRAPEHRLAGGSRRVYVADVTRHVCWFHEVRSVFDSEQLHVTSHRCAGLCFLPTARAGTHTHTISVVDVFFATINIIFKSTIILIK